MNICKEHDCPDICCWPHKKPEMKGGTHEICEALAVVQTRSFFPPEYLWMGATTLKYLLETVCKETLRPQDFTMSVISTGLSNEPKVVTFMGCDVILDDLLPKGLIQIGCHYGQPSKFMIGAGWGERVVLNTVWL